MSYIYRERERDDYDRPVTIKRYVIPSEDREDRREFSMSRNDYAGDRELVIRRKTEREEPMTVSRYEREIDYEPRRYERDYYEPRETDYDVVRRSDADEDPYYYHSRRRVREYDDRRSRRELSPGDSISQASRRRGDRDDYSSDDSMVYVRKETTRDYDDEHPHHNRHLVEGALVGVGAAELLRSRSKREGKEVSHGLGRAAKTAGAGALGAVAVNAAGHVRDYYRSKSRSRHRAHSDDERSRHRRHRSRGRNGSRSRSRSHSHSRAKTLLELGLGAAAVAAGVAAMRNNNKNKDERKSRSRTRSRSRGRALSTARSENDDARSQSKRRQHMVGAGLAGAAAAGLIEHVRSRSKSRKGEHSRSQSRIRKALPILAAGLGTAGITGLYEKNKAEKDTKEPVSRERRRSRSRSRAHEMHPDPARDSAGLIEYGNDPVTGSIPADHYYGQPALQNTAYYSDGADGRRHSRSRSRSRAPRYSSSSGSDRERRRSGKHRHRSRSRGIAEGVLGATGLGYAAHKYQQHRDRKEARSRSRSRSRSRTRYEDDAHRDPYEESYDPEPYPVSPHAAPHHPIPDPNYYPQSNYFPPPPGSTPNLNATTQPYNPADYPPPPGAAPPPEPYSYGAPAPGPEPYGPAPGPEPYAPRPRRADENVSAPQSSTLPTDQDHTRDGLDVNNLQPPPSVPRSGSQPAPSSKSVAFDLTPEPDRGYETDDSDSTIHSSSRRPHYSRRRSSSVPYSPPAPARSREYRHHSKHSQGQHHPESESDSTIDLPDRFDSHGRLITETEDPAVEKIEDLIKKFTRVLF
ncbi:uncharacterized protein N7498_000473 [Penicillium cinerascens]|uniref:DUF3824 domain-containing protein n=1 Tax=Penicillium cinerascens TaxID=70096 RepID=A0A9W9TDF7_9EURO|nr:uncharacterized protein N7498_000473 [Penicillium cinerascens]KAJ5218374.1 hypothetical protein N7498_000473 [Penicillium cinerascens]